MNTGDCVSYSAAKESPAWLIYVGEDFNQFEFGGGCKQVRVFNRPAWWKQRDLAGIKGIRALLLGAFRRA